MVVGYNRRLNHRLRESERKKRQVGILSDTSVCLFTRSTNRISNKKYYLKYYLNNIKYFHKYTLRENKLYFYFLTEKIMINVEITHSTIDTITIKAVSSRIEGNN